MWWLIGGRAFRSAGVLVRLESVVSLRVVGCISVVVIDALRGATVQQTGLSRGADVPGAGGRGVRAELPTRWVHSAFVISRVVGARCFCHDAFFAGSAADVFARAPVFGVRVR